MAINQENWNFTYYKSSKLKAFISLSGENRGDEVQILYTLTVTDEDDNEKFQAGFESLPQAVTKINSQYGHWEFVDLEQGKSSDDGGCGSCAAH
ncbi:MAG: hypothetical protein EP326_08195 [Deltaproteobacteria bacterium]|nr:MAG: hypothetical protein EP326_08195 [Deltaproteobacteria bacterium]TNF28450.1 MAG: hypothetical protein EP319_09000 [Deltaproteobacteria bacterium]